MFNRALEGKAVVVTGASSGIGRAIARALSGSGADVALLARGVDGLEAAAHEVRANGRRALVLPVDMTDAAAVTAAADRVASEWGSIDIWVNDAMVSLFAPVVDTTPTEFRRVMEVNYLGFVHGTLAALRHMRRRNAGLIVQLGSVLAYRSIPLQSAYCASKAAIRGFTDSLRSELAHDRSGVRVTMLQLPAVNTPQFDVVRSRLPDHPQPLPPIYQPEVIAKAVLHAVLHPKREMWISWSATKAIVAQRLIPGFLDRYLGKRAWKRQTTRQLPPGHPRKHDRDNLDTPIPGDRGAHGPFDSQARRFSTKLWARTHLGWAALAGAVVAAFGVGRLVRASARR